MRRIKGRSPISSSLLSSKYCADVTASSLASMYGTWREYSTIRGNSYQIIISLVVSRDGISRSRTLNRGRMHYA